MSKKNGVVSILDPLGVQAIFFYTDYSKNSEKNLLECAFTCPKLNGNKNFNLIIFSLQKHLVVLKYLEYVKGRILEIL